MNKRNLAVVLLCCAFALTLGLVGCGGGGGSTSSASSDPVAQSKEAFTGSWDLTGMVSGGEEISQNDISMLKERGMEVYLELNEDGTASLVIFGEAMTGTWTPKTATESTISIQNDTVDMTLDGGTLTLVQGDDQITFVKGEAHEPIAASQSQSLLDSVTFTETREFEPYVLADDNTAKIEVHARALDSDGDMGFLMTIANKADAPIYVTTIDGSFSVNGKLVDPVLAESVAAGDTVEAYLFFFNDELGAGSLDDLVAVEGTVEIWDDQSLDTLGSYAFQL